MDQYVWVLLSAENNLEKSKVHFLFDSSGSKLLQLVFNRSSAAEQRVLVKLRWPKPTQKSTLKIVFFIINMSIILLSIELNGTGCYCRCGENKFSKRSSIHCPYVINKMCVVLVLELSPLQKKKQINNFFNIFTAVPDF